MTELSDLSDEQLRGLHEDTLTRYRAFRDQGLKLNMARGKPAPEQLDLSNDLLGLPGAGHYTAADGTDCRNYGGGQGLPEARALLGEIVGAPPENTVVADNASLAMMHDHIVYSLLKGNPDSAAPWCREPRVRFLCPVPGYDRHFAICAEYGIEMINVPMLEDGPDMDRVEALVAEDPSIKGIWCVPKYANPTGAVYSDEVVERMARMPTAAADFRIFWDNAYAVHHLTGERVEIANLIEACGTAGNPDRALVFASTSKITFAGAGLGVFASSARNVEWYLARAGKRAIGPDKINQLRHLAKLPDIHALHRLMDGHRELIAPKFDAVHEAFARVFGDYRVATWTRPRGGYFISLDTPQGCAARTVELAREAGVVMTPAGATYPHGRDPEDRNVRVAPTFPSLTEVKQAAEGIAVATLLAAVEREIARREA
ncbi:putative aminotransferase [wastewater metagenome]|uniref:Putative aminotransferase/MSMEI_6121 n=3 Tax=root TaxID=1 RepID=A0A5B8RA15_9ZZZZ|nr:aminotransferase class I/II-fold pyridoxal phosphate-dependent enzyme [Arhodomonas aquaeolei]MCS4504045.1 aminotransferase class I/II-fold pyridoxal phosphate-dependent enzyme [Arhodomonas aquaeolei]QEA04222.1 putative aminotransferase/MSMEI_6121 [uncultured organism]